MQQLSKETKHRIYVKTYNEMILKIEKGEDINICSVLSSAIWQLKKENEIIYPFAENYHVLNGFIHFPEIQKYLNHYIDKGVNSIFSGVDAWDYNRDYCRFIIIKNSIYETASIVEKIKYLLTNKFNTYAKFF